LRSRVTNPSFILFASVLMTMALPLFAQDVVVVPDEVAASHLVKRIEPVYPPFPRAAGIHGAVRVRLRVSPSGATEFVGCELGPGFFLQAAQEAAEQFVYQPFLQDGKAIEAEFLADVVFRLPQGTQAHTYRPSPLTGAEFFAARPQIPIDSLSPNIRTWLTTVVQPHLESTPPSDREAKAKERLAGTTAVSIPTNTPDVHLYLFTTRTPDDCGNHNQCHTRLVEDRGGVIGLIADASSNGFTTHTHAGSPYPDIFLSDYAGASHLLIRGYSNVAGEWGQLYCGDILTDSGGDMQNDVHQCR
jgi:Gram-negative bacterial TonB protein C-terminal